jgi:hypothetical protein
VLQDGQRDPKGGPRHPKGSQREAKVAPKGAQGTPKGAKGRPKSPQREPKAPQREPKGAQSRPKGNQKDPKSTHYINKLPINRPSGRYVKAAQKTDDQDEQAHSDQSVFSGLDDDDGDDDVWDPMK